MPSPWPPAAPRGTRRSQRKRVLGIGTQVGVRLEVPERLLDVGRPREETGEDFVGDSLEREVVTLSSQRLDDSLKLMKSPTRGRYWPLPAWARRCRTCAPGGSYIACVLANKVARSTRGGGGLLLSERGLQVAQHTDLAEQDRSGVVAVERAHLPVLKTEDIAGRGVELLAGSRDRSQGRGKVT